MEKKGIEESLTNGLYLVGSEKTRYLPNYMNKNNHKESKNVIFHLIKRMRIRKEEEEEKEGQF